MAKCETCGTYRTVADKDFDPLQIAMNQPCGWYSKEREGVELCGRCMDMMIFTSDGETLDY